VLQPMLGLPNKFSFGRALLNALSHRASSLGSIPNHRVEVGGQIMIPLS
jgi:hypothetical protein